MVENAVEQGCDYTEKVLDDTLASKPSTSGEASSLTSERIETGNWNIHLYLTYMQRTLDTYSAVGETQHAIKVMGCNYVSDIAG